jgi:hypothetical protein
MIDVMYAKDDVIAIGKITINYVRTKRVQINRKIAS